MARRLVAERCLYGVDINPMAVEMAKLSLWLVTVQKDRPFTFLDHALKAGDALLGVDLQSLGQWHLGASKGKPIPFMALPVQHSLQTAINLRREIEVMPDHDDETVRHKERLLQRAERALDVLEIGGNLLVGVTLQGGADAEQDARRQHLLDKFVLALAAGEEQRASEGMRAPFIAHILDEDRAAIESLRAEANALLGGRRPFHWPLEFPEVFVDGSAWGDPGGFDALIGNPPFLGGSKITGPLGTNYRDYIVDVLAEGRRGKADLCTYFFLRAFHLLRSSAGFGLLATNTIAQGDSRMVGLDCLLAHDGIVNRAIPTMRWPGTASLDVAVVWLRSGSWNGEVVLDQAVVPSITAFLEVPGVVSGLPHALTSNTDKSFKGTEVRGMGFVLTPEEAAALIAKDGRNREVLLPFLSGDDLNSRPDQCPSRWVINFSDWPIDRAQSYKDCWLIVEAKVKPERQRIDECGAFVLRKPLPQRYWQFAEKQTALYIATDGMSRVICKTRHSPNCAFGIVPTGVIFQDALTVIAFDDYGHFAALSSTLHESWAWQYGSTLGAHTLRYTSADCFANYPFPDLMESLYSIGEAYFQYRQLVMDSRTEGLTNISNRFHAPDEAAEDIAKLRDLHVEMDYAVASAYGWDDLDFNHGFHQTKQGLRYTISEQSRREILGRLLALNHERYKQEVASGLHAKNDKKPGKRGETEPTNQMALAW